MSGLVFTKIVQLFGIVVLGVIAGKTKLLTGKSAQSLSKVLLYIVTPCVIINSYNRPFDAALFQELLQALFLSVFLLVILIFVARFLFKGETTEARVERLSAVYSNCGFMGLPLAYAVLGAKGVFITTAFIAVFNIFVWTHGVTVFRDSKLSLAGLKKILVTPAILGSVFGILIFALGWELPDMLAIPVRMVGDMNTPLAMIVAGINIAEADVLKTLRNRRIYKVLAAKLLVFPLLSALILAVFPWHFDVRFTIFLAMASPTATVITLLANNFGEDPRYAAEIFTVSTLLALVTIPLTAWVATLIIV